MAIRTAAVQYRSFNNPDDTLALAYHHSKHISHESPDIILLPEFTFYFDAQWNFNKYACALDKHPWVKVIQDWAKEFKCIVVAGSIPEKDLQSAEEKIFHTSVIAYPDERTPIFSRRRTLFRGFSQKQYINEAQHMLRSDDPPVTFDLNGWQVGLAQGGDLCYSSVFTTLRYQKKCDLILIPASFFQFQGRSLWLPLLKARAIEYQVYIVCANQCQSPKEATALFSGQSTIIDPWGDFLSLSKTNNEALCLQDCHKEALLRCRVQMDAAFNPDALNLKRSAL